MCGICVSAEKGEEGEGERREKRRIRGGPIGDQESGHKGLEAEGVGKAKGDLEVWEQGDSEVQIEKETHRGSRDI